ncbi:MAG TPA: hypothetical protein VIK25_02860, partial [Gemmatimonadaceae bacterium]
EPSLQRPDSAVHYLSRLVRLSPDAEVTRDLRWAGLDSLLAVARARTFALSVRPQREYVLIGTDGRGFIDVVTSQKATVVLTAASRITGSVVVVDSSVGTTRARLSMRAHDGQQALFQTGDYVMRVSAVNSARTDTSMVVLDVSAEGVPPVLARLPALDSSALKPEIEKSSRTKAVVYGGFIAASTYALSRYARTDTLLKARFQPDSRATKVGATIMLGAILGSIFDKGRPMPENVAGNTVLRANFARELATITQENREKVGSFKVTMRFTGGDTP